MDDFVSNSGGFSSSDAAGCSTDAGDCGAFSSSDTGGISSSCGGFSDSGPFSVDTFSNIGMTSNCDPGLGVSDYVQCDITWNNAYYNACFQNSMESETLRAHHNQIQVDSSLSTDPIPVMPSAPYLTTTTYGVLDGYHNMGGNMKLWEKTIPCNKTKDKERMLLRSKIAQLKLILAYCKADEHKKAAICAQIEDLTVQMERQGNGRRQDIFRTTNCQNHAIPVTRVYRPTMLYLTPTHTREDIKNRQPSTLEYESRLLVRQESPITERVHITKQEFPDREHRAQIAEQETRMDRCCMICHCILAIVLVTAFALGMGFGFK